MARFMENRERPVVVLGITHSPPNADVLLLTKEELREITSSSPRASVISIPEPFTYALYFVIAFVLEVIYLAIT